MATRPATREEIVQCDADLRELLGLMHERSAGGSSKQGRYLKPDTARRRYIKTVALPGLHVTERALARQLLQAHGEQVHISPRSRPISPDLLK